MFCSGSNRGNLGNLIKAPRWSNLGLPAARLLEQARRGTHNTASATDRGSTAAFIDFFHFRLYYIMPITSVSQEDILSWSRTALDKRRVPDLDTFIRLCNLDLPAVGDASRGSQAALLCVPRSAGSISWLHG